MSCDRDLSNLSTGPEQPPTPTERNGNWRIACPGCRRRIDVNDFKLHCLRRHAFTAERWKRFLSHQTSQALVNVIEGILPRPNQRREPSIEQLRATRKAWQRREMIKASIQRAYDLAGRARVIQGGRVESNRRTH